jgi:hypothetical protein
MKGSSKRALALPAATAFLLLFSTTGTWGAGGTVTDTTIFNLQAPWTTPARDYVSRTYGVATFLSGPQGGGTDGIRWVHHFSLPSSPIIGASLYITLEDDGDSNREDGALSCEGYWIDVGSYHPPGGIAQPIPLTCPDYGPLPNAGCWFEVDNGTY